MSNFRSGENQSERWFHHQYSGLFNKGRGISKMVRDFIVNDRRDPFVRLNEDEIRVALQDHPDLTKKNRFIFRG